MAALQNYPTLSPPCKKPPPLPKAPQPLSFSSTFPSTSPPKPAIDPQWRGPNVRCGRSGQVEQHPGDYLLRQKLFSNHEVFGFFSNPTVDPGKKRQVVDELSQSSALQPHTANFLNIPVDAKRIDLLNDIVKEFEAVYTGAKNVSIKTVIDPSLVAGFTVRYGPSGSKLIDMSVKKQLDELAAQLEIGDIQLAQ